MAVRIPVIAGYLPRSFHAGGNMLNYTPDNGLVFHGVRWWPAVPVLSQTMDATDRWALTKVWT